MNDYIMIEIAFGSKKEVDESVNILLDNKLVASTQVFTSESTWNYKGKRTNKKEYILLLKTKEELINDIYNVIKIYIVIKFLNLLYLIYQVQVENI